MSKQVKTNKNEIVLIKNVDMVFVHIFEPSRFDEKSEYNKNLTVVLDKTENAQQIKDLQNKINTILAENDYKTSPLKDGDILNKKRFKEDKKELDMYENSYIMTVKTNKDFEVPVVNGYKQPLTIDGNFDKNNWFGNVAISLVPYKGFGGGVCAYIKAIQVLDNSRFQNKSNIVDVFDEFENNNAENENELPFA